jgi:hypothetical protein
MCRVCPLDTHPAPADALLASMATLRTVTANLVGDAAKTDARFRKLYTQRKLQPK